MERIGKAAGTHAEHGGGKGDRIRIRRRKQQPDPVIWITARERIRRACGDQGHAELCIRGESDRNGMAEILDCGDGYDHRSLESE